MAPIDTGGNNVTKDTTSLAGEIARKVTRSCLAHHVLLWFLVRAMEMVGGRLLACFANVATTRLAPGQEQCCGPVSGRVTCQKRDNGCVPSSCNHAIAVLP